MRTEGGLALRHHGGERTTGRTGWSDFDTAQRLGRDTRTAAARSRGIHHRPQHEHLGAHLDLVAFLDSLGAREPLAVEVDAVDATEVLNRNAISAHEQLGVASRHERVVEGYLTRRAPPHDQGPRPQFNR